jgi:hypothetical protein
MTCRETSGGWLVSLISDCTVMTGVRSRRHDRFPNSDAGDNGGFLTDAFDRHRNEANR